VLEKSRTRIAVTACNAGRGGEVIDLPSAPEYRAGSIRGPLWQRRRRAWRRRKERLYCRRSSARLWWSCARIARREMYAL